MAIWGLFLKKYLDMLSLIAFWSCKHHIQIRYSYSIMLWNQETLGAPSLDRTHRIPVKCCSAWRAKSFIFRGYGSHLVPWAFSHKWSHSQIDRAKAKAFKKLRHATHNTPYCQTSQSHGMLFQLFSSHASFWRSVAAAIYLGTGKQWVSKHTT